MYTKHFNKGNKASSKDVGKIVDGSERSTYWVGYLYANANYMIVKNQIKGLRVVCTEGEKEHLHQLSTYLDYRAYPIRTNKLSTNLILSIHNVDLVGYLSAIGLYQHMGERVLLDRSYATNTHFWRGYCDGNGLLYGDNVESLQFRVQANDDLMADWLLFIGPVAHDILHHKRHQEWIATGDAARTVLVRLYANASIASPRMWDIAYQHLTDEQRATDGVFV